MTGDEGGCELLFERTFWLNQRPLSRLFVATPFNYGTKRGRNVRILPTWQADNYLLSLSLILTTVWLNTGQECGKIDTLPHRSITLKVGAISIQRENNHCVPLLTQKSLSQLCKWFLLSALWYMHTVWNIQIVIGPIVWGGNMQKWIIWHQFNAVAK